MVLDEHEGVHDDLCLFIGLLGLQQVCYSAASLLLVAAPLLAPTTLCQSTSVSSRHDGPQRFCTGCLLTGALPSLQLLAQERALQPVAAVCFW